MGGSREAKRAPNDLGAPIAADALLLLDEPALQRHFEDLTHFEPEAGEPFKVQVAHGMPGSGRVPILCAPAIHRLVDENSVSVLVYLDNPHLFRFHFSIPLPRGPRKCRIGSVSPGPQASSDSAPHKSGKASSADCPCEPSAEQSGRRGPERSGSALDSPLGSPSVHPLAIII